jgi:hypothetical protein
LHLDSFLGHQAAFYVAGNHDSGRGDVAGDVCARLHNDEMSSDMDRSLDASRDDHVFVCRQLTFDHHGRSHTSAFEHCRASNFELTMRCTWQTRFHGPPLRGF